MADEGNVTRQRDRHRRTGRAQTAMFAAQPLLTFCETGNHVT